MGRIWEEPRRNPSADGYLRATKSLGERVRSFYIFGEALSALPPSNASNPDLRFADITGRVTQATVQFPTFIDGRFSFQI